MMEHDELISEKEQMDKMPVGERIRLGKKRRKQQLAQYEKLNRRESNQKPGPDRAKRLKFTTDVTLLEIASRGAVDEMQYLIKAGANPNMANHDGLTAMHQCCIDGSMEMVSLLLKAGANVNLTDRDLWTPLHAAATCGHLEISQMLIKAGANLTAVNGDGDMPYDITEDEETLQYLENEMIKRGITQDAIEKARTSFHDEMLHDVKNLIKTKSFLDIPQDQGGTLLHVAISNGFEDISEILMKSGTSLTAEDEDGWQPIHVAAFWGMVKIVELLAREYSVNLRVRTNLGETPYELCDDIELKGLMLDILNENPIETDNDSQKFEGEINFALKNENGEISENKTVETFVIKDKIERENSDEGTITEEKFDNENNISLENTEIDTEIKTHPIVNDHSNERMVADRRGSMKEIKLNASFRSRSNSDLAKRINAISQNKIIDEGNNNKNEAFNTENGRLSQEEAINFGEHTMNEKLYKNETNPKEHLISISKEIDNEKYVRELQTVEDISVSYSESITHKIQQEEIENKTGSLHVLQNGVLPSQSVQSKESDNKNNELAQKFEDMTTAIDNETNEIHETNEIYETTVKYSDEIHETNKFTETNEIHDTNEIYETTVKYSDEIHETNKFTETNEIHETNEIYETNVKYSDNFHEASEIISNNNYEKSILQYENVNDTQEEKEEISNVKKNSINNESESESDENSEHFKRNDNIYENESNINDLNTHKTQQDMSQSNESSNKTKGINISELTPPPTPDTSVILRNKSTTESFNNKSLGNNATNALSNSPNQKPSDNITSALEARTNKPSLPEGIQRNSLQYIKLRRQQNRLSTAGNSIKETANDYPNSSWYTPTMFQPPMTVHRYAMTESEFVGKKKKKKNNFVKKEKGCVIM